jgi:hypothetical protein
MVSCNINGKALTGLCSMAFMVEAGLALFPS